MSKKLKNWHVGGVQLPLLKPASDWKPPADLPDLRSMGEIVVDIENKDDWLSNGRGSGWPARAGHICGIAVAWTDGAFYAAVRHPGGDCLDIDRVREWVRDHFLCPDLKVIMHHASHDVGWLQAQWGIKSPIHLVDTEAEAMIVDENRFSYRLDDLCKWRGIAGKDETLLSEAAASHGLDAKADMWKLPARYVGPYAEQDARATLALHQSLQAEIKEQGLEAALQLEHDLIPMCIEMRRRGIRVNLDAAERCAVELLKRRDETFQELSSKLGVPVGMDEIGSNRWLEPIFEEHAPEIPIPRTAPTARFTEGQPSFTAGTTGWMHKHPHWLPKLLVRADRLNNCASKFVRGFIIKYATNNRIHSSINQYRGEEGGTRTFRFSYSNPALQQMPSREDKTDGMLYIDACRTPFEPEPGEIWGAHDYSQQELRLIVHYAYLMKLPRAADAHRMYCDDPNTDFHKLVVDWTGLDRGSAKNTNFAKAYRAGIGKFAAMIDKTPDEAQEIYNRYDAELPFVSRLMERADKEARKRGYIRLLDGARKHFDTWVPAYMGYGEERPYALPRPLAEAKWPGVRLVIGNTYKAGNALIQGSAARMTKLCMRECWKAGIVPLLQMHDELDFSHASEAEAIQVAEIMRDTVKLEVPVRVDSDYGKSWGTARSTWDEATSKSDS